MSWPGGGSGGGEGSVSFRLDNFSPTNGQTAFALSASPSTPSQVLAWVNGVLYENGVDYTVAGSTLTWTNALFALGPPDLLEAYYVV
jgi:hypothetical protein